LPTYSQDTISVIRDSINYNLPDIETLKPIVFKKHGKVYYGFDTEQSEYIYNSLMHRDFYFHKFKIKVEDFNNITELYQKKINNLNESCLYKDSINFKQDTIIQSQKVEFEEKEKIYKKQIRKEKIKSVLGTVGGIAIGVVGTLIIIAL